MGSLNWQDIPAESPSPLASDSAHPLTASSSSPWFAVTMGLMGFIVGYMLANLSF